MKNGKCPTWFVVKWLEKHPKHTAEAPKAAGECAERAKAFGQNCISFAYESSTGWRSDSFPRQRSDWTIYNEHGEPVKFKPKRESLIIGELLPGEELVVYSGETRSNIMRNCGTDTVDVLIRSRRK